MEKKLKFEFTVEEINLILASLGRMPYESVTGIISEIQVQARSQIEAQKVNSMVIPESDITE